MAMTKIPKGLTKVMAAIHMALYRISGGKLGGRMGKGIICLLTTIGRKSGKARTMPLITKERDGAYVVIASFSGHDVHPAWYLNLKANPEATLRIGKTDHKITAEDVEGEERSVIYQEMTDLYPDYEAYQNVTDRIIPVVRLVPS